MEGAGQVDEPVEDSSEAPHLNWKESDKPPQQPESYGVLGSSAPTTPLPSSWSADLFMETLAGKNSGPLSTGPRSSDPRVMVGRTRDSSEVGGGMQADRTRSVFSAYLPEIDDVVVSSKMVPRIPDGIRTKVLPASGLPRFLVKNSLKGKGVAYKHPGNPNAPVVAIPGRADGRGDEEPPVGSDSDLPCRPGGVADDPSQLGSVGLGVSDLQRDGISLRDWIRLRCCKSNNVERMHIFKQILELVDASHSQELTLQHLRPSYFMISPSKQVKYVGSFVRFSQMDRSEGTVNPDYLEHHLKRRKQFEQGKETDEFLIMKHQKLSDRMIVSHLHGKLVDEFKIGSLKAENCGHGFRGQMRLCEAFISQNIPGNPAVSSIGRRRLVSEILELEERWCASPEELDETMCPSSNIYSLGVLLFELFCYFESREMHSAAMSDLHHRILPSSFLSENPKEACFCLWMLHPQSSSRPKTGDILNCALIKKDKDISSLDHPSLSVDEKDTEAGLLLNFLLSLKEQKVNQAVKLAEDIGFLEADIDEVERRHSPRTEFLPNTRGQLENFNNISDEYHKEKLTHPESMSRLCMSDINKERLMRNIDQLENAYFSMKSKVKQLEFNSAARSDEDVLKLQNRWSPVQNDAEIQCADNGFTNRLGAFFEGLCKYARYSKFEVRGGLRNVDILSSANAICSLSFDRDEDYFATAGVSKKIKIFEFGPLLTNTVDVHYPVIEMSNKSKLSCVCWNGYIKNYLASTDYDGAVQLWDASTGQGFMRYLEHQKRAWSVDFSLVDPTKLASSSDDCSVKLWSIREKNCIDTIRNVANVCCVQFSNSSHLLSFGSADYKIYCYDLRNTRIPWCTLTGHGKAVSYVKFLDSETLVSASTDSSLKLWDLKRTNASGLSTAACHLTMSGHTNERNFVGLSVWDGYIACGSETNKVYAYYKTLPMPMAYHEFGFIDPFTGQETDDDYEQFISSVCWRGKSGTMVAANSSGSIKLLEMV